MIRPMTLPEVDAEAAGHRTQAVATPGDMADSGPALGEHTDDVLRESGYDQPAIAALRKSGVAG